MKRLLKDGIYTDAGNDISAEFKSNVIVLLRGYLEKYDAIDVEHILVNTLRDIFSMERLNKVKITDGTNSIKSEPMFADEETYRAFKKEFYETVQKTHSEEVEQRRKDMVEYIRTGIGNKPVFKAHNTGKSKLRDVIQTHAMEDASSSYVNQDGYYQDVVDDILWDKRKPSCIVIDECQNMDKSQSVRIEEPKLDIFKATLKEKI